MKNNKEIYCEIKKCYKYGIISFILIMGMELLSIVPPIFMKKIIDIYIPKKNINEIYISILILAIIPIISTLISVLFNSFLFVNIKRISFDIRANIVKKVLHQPIEFFLKYTTGELMEYCGQDVSNFIYFWLMDFPGTICNIIMSITLVCILFGLNIKLTLFQIIALPLIILPGKYFGKKIKDYSIKIIESNAMIKQIINESFRGIKTVKIFGLQENRIKQMKWIFNKSIKFFSKTAMLEKLYGEWGQKFIVVIFTSISFGLCAINVIKGSISLGDMILFTTYLPKMYTYITQISLINLKFNKQLGEYSKQFDLMALNVEDDNDLTCSLNELRGKVEFRNVSFKYPGSHSYTLDKFSFILFPGEFMGVTGPNGIGKSTLFNLLFKFYDSYEGDIYIDDVNLRDIPQKYLVKNISLVSQDVFLFNGTLRENFMMANSEVTENEIIHILDDVNLKLWFETLPNGLDSEIGENGSSLSGGQRQRIALAMGIMKKSTILLLDEVTASLDTESEVKVRETVDNLRLNKNITIIAISHREDLLKNASKICSLSKTVEKGR